MENFHNELKHKIDIYIHRIYAESRNFPKKETYGISQLRRAAVSVMLNYIEGYASRKPLVHKNFIETAYGSLQESKYLLLFSVEEKYLGETEYKKLSELVEDIGKMFWGMLRRM